MVRSYSAGPGQRADAINGKFKIFGETVNLHVPIDWHQDPFETRSWRMYLHALDALKPLLVHYRDTGEIVALERARDIAFDWIEQNRRGAEGVSEFAWYDMSVAYRAVRLAYLYRALAHESLMTADQRKRLECSLNEHAYWLADNAHYKYLNNHGLYEDTALFIVAKQLDQHPDADGWRRRATQRFVTNVTSTVSMVDGVHLEHSPAYHVIISGLLDKLINELGLGSAELAGLHDKMVAAAPWFVMPDGRYPQFGDTNLSPPPKWVLDSQSQCTGFVAFLDAGAAIYRDDRSYFMSVAWFHRRRHKHADETSFVWAEGGRRLIVDTGRYGYYYEEPGRVYAESSPAHSTLTIDPPFAWRGNKPYGSAVLGTASSNGWHVVLMKNPLLAKQSVEHRRVFAYRPGRWLVVVDQLSVQQCPASTRRFHFAPGLEVAQRTDSAVRLTDDIGSVWMQTATPPQEIREVVGRREPSVQGFTFPSDRKWVNSTAVEVVDRVCGIPMVVVLSVGDETPPPAVVAEAQRDELQIVLGGQRVRVGYAADELELTVE